MTETIKLPLLIEGDQLVPLLPEVSNGNLLIIDTCSSEQYQRAHIPAAVHVPPQSLQGGVKPGVGRLPSTVQLQGLMSSIGLRDDVHVVVYDDEGGGWAGRFIWTLDAIGFSNYSYINGGIHAWQAANLPVESTVNHSKVTEYKVTIDHTVIAEIDDIVPLLGSDQIGIWDARSEAEYRGEKVLADRGGHIPGAVNIDWLELIDRDNNTRLIDLDGLQTRLNECGLTQDKLIVTHCQTHHRSGLTYLAMKLLGYPNIKGYHGSWSEWGNSEDTPIEK